MTAALEPYENLYLNYYIDFMARRLGISASEQLDRQLVEKLVGETFNLLIQSQWSYPDFFAQLRLNFSSAWRDNPDLILENSDIGQTDCNPWRSTYQQVLSQLSPELWAAVPATLEQANPITDLLRPRIETIWEAIAVDDNWQPFNELVQKLQTGE